MCPLRASLSSSIFQDRFEIAQGFLAVLIAVIQLTAFILDFLRLFEIYIYFMYFYQLFIY